MGYLTICDLFPKLFLSSRQNPVTKIGIVYNSPSKRATVRIPSCKMLLKVVWFPQMKMLLSEGSDANVRGNDD